MTNQLVCPWGVLGPRDRLPDYLPQDTRNNLKQHLQQLREDYHLGTAPQESLAAFALISLLLLIDVLRGLARGTIRLFGVILVLILVGGIIPAACMSNPPPAPAPEILSEAKDPDTCRLPFLSEGADQTGQTAQTSHIDPKNHRNHRQNQTGRMSGERDSG